MGVYSGSALIGESSVGVVNNNVHVLDTLIESAQNEMNMFNAVINLDFMDAYNEAGIITLSEADSDDAKKNAEQSIGKKIKDFFKKVIEKIKTFVSTFVAKIQNLVRNDAALYKEYNENFNKNAKGYKLAKFRKLQPLSSIASNYGGLIGDFIKQVKGSINNVTKDGVTNKDIDEELDYIDNYVKYGAKDNGKARRENRDEWMKYIDGIFFASDESKEDYELTSTDIEVIDDVMAAGAKRIIAQVKKVGDAGTSFCTRIQKELKIEKQRFAASDDNMSMSVWNAEYKIAVKCGNFISKTTSAACNSAARYVAAARRAFVVAGKNATEKKVSESYGMDMETYDGILSEASDIYVEKVLGVA